jgi:hypothetical protein
MLITDLVSYLQQQSSITALVGQRIQPVPAPEDLTQYPCLTFQIASYLPEYTMDGSIGLAQYRIVFDCFGLRYLDAANLSSAIVASLSGFTGTIGTTHVWNCEIVNQQDHFQDGARLYRTSVHALLQIAE